MSLTDRLRRWSSGILTPLGERLHRLGIHPNAVTLLGLLIVAIAAILIGRGMLRVGGVILLLGLPFDALDGAIARARGEDRPFGAFFDSVLDRYADGFIFAALSYHFAVQGQFALLMTAQLALIGTLLVSYTRARGDGVGVASSVGLFTRVERTIVIIVMLLIPTLVSWGVILLAIGTHVTAIQRIWFVNTTLINKGD